MISQCYILSESEESAYLLNCINFKINLLAPDSCSIHIYNIYELGCFLLACC